MRFKKYLEAFANQPTGINPNTPLNNAINMPNNVTNQLITKAKNSLLNPNQNPDEQEELLNKLKDINAKKQTGEISDLVNKIDTNKKPGTTATNQPKSNNGTAF